MVNYIGPNKSTEDDRHKIKLFEGSQICHLLFRFQEESAKGGIHKQDSESAEPIKQIISDDSHDGATVDSYGADNEKETTEAEGAEAAEAKDDEQKLKDDLDLSHMSLNIQRPRSNSGSRYLTDKVGIF